MKTCGKCGKRKRLDQFHYNANTRDRRQTWCIPCARESARESYERRRDEVRARKIEKRTGRPESELPRQCAICGESAVLFMDHCHESDLFRDMLCRSCNTGLGMFKDNPVLLEGAAAYLRLHQRKVG